MIHEVIDLIRQQATRSQIEIKLELDDDIEVHGVAEQIKQALINLVLNALQAMPAGGTLTVSTRIAANEYYIDVEDNGPGVSPEDRERIFNPFVTTRDSGTGLGLAITQRIIHSHEGRIILKSKPGEGAKFIVCLPLQTDKMETQK